MFAKILLLIIEYWLHRLLLTVSLSGFAGTRYFSLFATGEGSGRSHLILNPHYLFLPIKFKQMCLVVASYHAYVIMKLYKTVSAWYGRPQVNTNVKFFKCVSHFAFLLFKKEDA